MRRISIGALFVSGLLFAGGVAPAAGHEQSESGWTIGALLDAAGNLWRRLTEDVPPDERKQRETIADIRTLGTALFSWLTDQVAAGAAGEQQAVKPADYPKISQEDLAKLLVPQYLQSLPKVDGWGHPYDIRVKVGDARGGHILFIRSPGRDGRYSDRTGAYRVGPFLPGHYDEDLVWADGFFVRWPQHGERSRGR